jgi:hypothetical protein
MRDRFTGFPDHPDCGKYPHNSDESLETREAMRDKLTRLRFMNRKLRDALKRLLLICEGEGWEPIDKSWTDPELNAARETISAADKD